MIRHSTGAAVKRFKSVASRPSAISISASNANSVLSTLVSSPPSSSEIATPWGREIHFPVEINRPKKADVQKHVGRFSGDAPAQHSRAEHVLDYMILMR